MSAVEAAAGAVPGAAPGVATVVCALERIRRESGVAALVDGEAVAVFRTHDDALFALGNVDPFTGASVLARGIVGTRTVAGGADGGAGEEVPFVASPLLKQAFDLRTGRCLDDPSVTVPTYDVQACDGVVVVGARRGMMPGCAS